MSTVAAEAIVILALRMCDVALRDATIVIHLYHASSVARASHVKILF
jgi:hypothetical protein